MMGSGWEHDDQINIRMCDEILRISEGVSYPKFSGDLLCIFLSPAGYRNDLEVRQELEYRNVAVPAPVSDSYDSRPDFVLGTHDQISLSIAEGVGVLRGKIGQGTRLSANDPGEVVENLVRLYRRTVR